tara:strand:+ start:25 stop:486 length:462 start_codon:yes stop_codon:yes gene_type:complete
MLLTIIPVDGNVKKDGVGYLELDLSSCAIPSNVRALQWRETKGWLEFWDKQNEDITALPNWVDCCLAVWTVANTPVPPKPPTSEDNKTTAITLLKETDWTTIPDVSDPTKSNPYLSNANDFVTYRNAVRQYAINPVEGYITWPIIPQEVWTTV